MSKLRKPPPPPRDLDSLRRSAASRTRTRSLRAVLGSACVAIAALGATASISPAATSSTTSYAGFTADVSVPSSTLATQLDFARGRFSTTSTVDQGQTTQQVFLQNTNYATPAGLLGYTLINPGTLGRVGNLSGSWDPATADCLARPAGTTGDWPAQGTNVECANGAKSVTLTFDPPVVDPVLDLATAGIGLSDADAANAVACDFGYSDVAVTAVNGVASSTGAYRIEAPDGLSANTTSLSDGRLTYTADPNGLCAPWRTVSNKLQISGLVSSVQVTTYQRDVVMKQGSPGGWFGIGRTWVEDFTSGTSWVSVIPRMPSVNLQVTKSAPDTIVAGGPLEWTVSVKNLSTTGSHGYVITDAVPESVTDVELVSGPAGCSLSGRDLLCSMAPDGWTLDVTDPAAPTLTGGDPTADIPVVLAAGATSTPIVLRGTSSGSAGDVIANTATVAGVDYDPNSANNSSTAETLLTEPTWSVAKTATLADGGGYASPGDVITYAVTATNSGDTDVANVTLTDDMSAVLAHADIVPGSATLTVGTAASSSLPDPSSTAPTLVAGPFTLPAGQSAVLTYQVTVQSEAWSNTLTNTVSADGDSAPGTCANGVTPADVCRTDTTVTAALDLLKRGTVNGSVVALDGSAFEVLADAAGAPGDVLAGLPVTAGTGTGTFTIEDVEPGTYWLRETRAPDGHELLAQAVRFTVDDTGAVTLSDPAADSQVTVEGGRLVVTDSPRFDLPTTGGSGTGALRLLGCLLLLAAAGTTAAAVIHRRRHLRGSAVPEEVSITG